MAKTPQNVAGMRPDDFVQAGLMDDFDGTIVRARFLPWDYNGRLDHYIFAVRLTIQPDEDDEFEQFYSAGDLGAFVPADEDGEPVDVDGWDGDDTEEVEGVYAYQAGKRKSMSNNTNWAAFIFALRDAGFPEEDIEADIRFVEGVHAHFNRIPQQKRSGIVRDDGESRPSDILVVTQLFETDHEPASGGTSKKASKASKASSKKAAASDDGGDDELRAEVEAKILEALAEAKDGELSKAKLPALVIKKFDGKEKAAAVKLVANADFLASSEAFNFDPDEGTISLG